MTKIELLQSLTSKVNQLYAQYAQHTEQKLNTKFDPQLFGENSQSFSFYYQEIQETLKQLAHVPENDLNLAIFFTEKLLSQCTALSDALNPITVNTMSKKTQQMAQSIHQLPPRERLEKYYVALQALNEKITQQQDEKHKTQDPNERSYLEQKIAFTQQRRDKCLMAIEVLEEYLIFKENQI
ncbi:primosomal replication protein N'' [Pasteurella canis]|uniref:Primosomal replication protein N n=1 Tax=Pasteurella canis TaxID=753 RepID=A0A379ESI8_9PAST|nr:primosomal replication protein PriC [Pasteurella canis]SUC09019.1 primosomal replication protein N'' [Pasteurella canis]